MVCYIELTQGKRAIIDDCSFEELRKHAWHAAKRGHTFYAVSRERVTRRTMLMHREVLRLAGVELSAHTDHRNGDGLDNRLANLRPASAMENASNKMRRRHGFKGIFFCKANNKWCAQIGHNNSHKHLGYFLSDKAAAAAYDAAAIELFGEFARLNFVAKGE